MKVEEMFEAIEPMVAQMEKGTTLFMLGCDAEKECGVIKGKEKDIINVLVSQMIREEHIERIIMVAAEAFIDYAEHIKPSKNPNLS